MAWRFVGVYTTLKMGIPLVLRIGFDSDQPSNQLRHVSGGGLSLLSLLADMMTGSLVTVICDSLYLQCYATVGINIVWSPRHQYQLETPGTTHTEQATTVHRWHPMCERRLIVSC